MIWLCKIGLHEWYYSEYNTHGAIWECPIKRTCTRCSKVEKKKSDQKGFNHWKRKLQKDRGKFWRNLTYRIDRFKQKGVLSDEMAM